MDVHKAAAVIINNEDTRFIQRIIIQILRHYAEKTTNTVDDALVDEVERRLFPS